MNEREFTDPEIASFLIFVYDLEKMVYILYLHLAIGKRDDNINYFMSQPMKQWYKSVKCYTVLSDFLT